MVMVSPVRGLRPVRSGRDRVEKAPKPAIVTVSPLASASAMAENTALTAESTSDLDREVLAATWAASSRLFIVDSSRQSAHPSVSRYRWSSDTTSTKGPLGRSESSVEPGGRDVRSRDVRRARCRGRHGPARGGDYVWVGPDEPAAHGRRVAVREFGHSRETVSLLIEHDGRWLLRARWPPPRSHRRRSATKPPSGASVPSSMSPPPPPSPSATPPALLFDIEYSSSPAGVVDHLHWFARSGPPRPRLCWSGPGSAGSHRPHHVLAPTGLDGEHWLG